MDNQRVLLAIVLSLAILLGYNYFFIPRPVPPTGLQQTGTETVQGSASPATAETTTYSQASVATPADTVAPVTPRREGRDIFVETSLYAAVISENGGGVKSFKLKNYTEELDPASRLKEHNKQEKFNELPLYFSWGNEPASSVVPVYDADRTELILGSGESATLTMRATLPSGVVMNRVMTFRDDSYEIGLDVSVANTSPQHQVQGAGYLSLVNEPFGKNDNERFVFTGPALFQNDALEEIKVDDLEDGPLERSGTIDWVAYEGIYFMTALIPVGGSHTVRFKRLTD